jgi:hypothetical protein
MTAAEALQTEACLTLTEVADILRLTHTRGAKKGTPDRRLAVDLVATGKLRVVDADQPAFRWTVSTGEVRRYLGAGVGA